MYANKDAQDILLLDPDISNDVARCIPAEKTSGRRFVASKTPSYLNKNHGKYPKFTKTIILLRLG